MNVVLEGPDAAGKSTLAEALSKALDMPIQQGSGPPKSPIEFHQRVHSYLMKKDHIFDRHPCVSQVVYGSMRQDGVLPHPGDVSRFYAQKPVIIYCRPNDGAIGLHKVKPDEDPAHIQLLTAKYAEITTAYDRWALEHAHLIYRIGDDMTQVVDIVRVIAC